VLEGGFRPVAPSERTKELFVAGSSSDRGPDWGLIQSAVPTYQLAVNRRPGALSFVRMVRHTFIADGAVFGYFETSIERILLRPCSAGALCRGCHWQR
jgi:hypothetical protein